MASWFDLRLPLTPFGPESWILNFSAISLRVSIELLANINYKKRFIIWTRSNKAKTYREKSLTNFTEYSFDISCESKNSIPNYRVIKVILTC